MTGRIAPTVKTVRAYTLCQLEARFGAWLPKSLFPKAPNQANSRDRIYTRSRTFWSMLWQGLNPKAAGREVVRQIQALFVLHGGPSVSEEDGLTAAPKPACLSQSFPRPSGPPPKPPTGWLPPCRCSKAARSRSRMARR
jgi:hypothetical protein